MSTKTLRKRIALVAVSAMGFGLLTSVAANATDATSQATTVGLVGPISGSSLAQSATLLSTGSLVLDDQGTTVVSSGAAISSATGTNDSQTCTTGAPTITPTGAVGTTFTVSIYAASACTSLGTLNQVITVTIAGTSLAGTPSASNSSVAWVDYAASTSSNAKYMGTADQTGKSSDVRNGKIYLHVQLRDVYNAPITTTTGSLTAEVSSGAVVNIGGGTDAGTTIDKGTYTTAANAATLNTAMNNDLTDATNDETKGHAWVRVDEKTAGTGWSGTVKISYNGVVIATKSGKITGDVAKLTATPIAVGQTSGDTTYAFAYNAYDSAGNQVKVDETKVKLDSSSNPSVVTAILGTDPNDPAADDPSGYGQITCGSAGKSDVVFYFVNEAGSIVKSAKATFNCGGAADSYKASFDKASYKQGDIATLTVTFYDVAGNLANSVSPINDTTTADQVISAPQMVRVTEAGTFLKNKKPNGSGARVYTYTVGTDSGVTAGSYNAIVSFPTINKKDGTDQSVAYTITSGGTSISNAEVLAAIVKLIASINKQITALQKLLTKKK